MMGRNAQYYLFAWMAYMAFSMLAFPYLRVTVMLASIPLTMLGAWFFRYKGALATTALTIPYHYMLLHVHTNDPFVLIETLNPFGIGSQLLFSLSTALLKSNQLRYLKLNNELELIVEERTNDLRELTDHLVNMEYIDRSIITSGLLDDPQDLLKKMLQSSTLLCLILEDRKFPEVNNARIIKKHIQQCMAQLTEFMHESITGTDSATLLENINKLANKMMLLGGGQLAIAVEGEWVNPDREATLQIHNIVSEAVSNAIRHAKATEISIGCTSNLDSTTIVVENNGENLPENMQEGMGLPLMRYRARRIHATLSIEGAPDARTRVAVTLPKNGAEP